MGKLSNPWEKFSRIDLDAGTQLYSEAPTETPIGTLYDDDFLELANKIILQAVEDYSYGYKQMLIAFKAKRFFPTKEEFERAHNVDCARVATTNIESHNINSKICLYYETLDFFESEWGMFLLRNCKVPYKDILAKVEKDVEMKLAKKNSVFKGKGLNAKKSLV